MTAHTLGVIGCGTMGAGIVYVAARAGFSVVFREMSEPAVAAGWDRLRRAAEGDVRRGHLDAAAAANLLERVRGSTDWGALAGMAAVIEAVYEDLAAKREAMAAVGRVLTPAGLVASNTSALSVAAVAAAYPWPERVIGLHFFNPPQRRPLVEVVQALRSSAEAVAQGVVLARAMGREPVVTRDTPGFLVNRLFIPYLNQAVQAYDDGLASAEDLDQAVHLGLGYPMGPLALADLIGVDVHLHAAEAAYRELPRPELAPPPLLRRMVDGGRLGRKTGRGFYEYTANR